jgi:oxalate decarboxylase family bicupin protein
MRLDPGGVPELHWHLPAEWSYVLYSSARITAVDQDGRGFVKDVKEGDLWYFPSGIRHSIQGLGPDGCEFLLVFDDGKFSEFDTFLITEWMAHTPREVLAKNFGVVPEVFDPIPKEELRGSAEDRKGARWPGIAQPVPTVRDGPVRISGRLPQRVSDHARWWERRERVTDGHG